MVRINLNLFSILVELSMREPLIDMFQNVGLSPYSPFDFGSFQVYRVDSNQSNTYLHIKPKIGNTLR